MSKGVRGARALLVCLLTVSCQTYDFQPITPFTVTQLRYHELRFAKGLKPNLMLLVDQSGSMNFHLDASCTSNCPTRISELKSAMAGFLPDAGGLARLGLTVFPSPVSACLPANAATMLVPLPAASATDEGTEAVLAQAAHDVATQVQGIKPSGGTPTGASVAYLGTLPELTDETDGRDDYVLLLTDGLPNCNPDNPVNLCGAQTPEAIAACSCLAGTCAADSGFCHLGCLDQGGTVGEIQRLRAKRVKTIVVGFGAEVAGSQAAQVLEAMGQAGQFPFSCDAGSQCGTGDVCDPVTHECGRHYFLAADGDQLGRALQQISEVIHSRKPCEVVLGEQPADPSLISVEVDGVDVQPGPSSWSYVAATNAVTFADGSTWCAKLEASTDVNPVELEVRMLNEL